MYYLSLTADFTIATPWIPHLAMIPLPGGRSSRDPSSAWGQGHHRQAGGQERRVGVEAADRGGAGAGGGEDPVSHEGGEDSVEFELRASLPMLATHGHRLAVNDANPLTVSLTNVQTNVHYFRGFRVIKKDTKEFIFDKPGVSAIAAPRVYAPSVKEPVASP